MKSSKFATGLVVFMLGGCASQGGPAPEPSSSPAAEVSPAQGVAPVGPERVEVAPELPPEQAAALRVERMVVTPERIELKRGETFPMSKVEVKALDAEGREVEGVLIRRFMMSPVAGIEDDEIRTRAAGEGALSYFLSIPATPSSAARFLNARVTVVVLPDPVDRVDLEVPDRIYVGTAMRLVARALTHMDDVRDDLPLQWSSAHPDVARVDELGFLWGLSPGETRVQATVDGVAGEATIVVEDNPVRSIGLSPSGTTTTTGDVVHFEVTVRDASGNVMEDVPVVLSVSGAERWEAVGATVYEDGAFVADLPGSYLVTASVGTVSGSAVIRAELREAAMDVVRVGQGLVSDHGTTDLWVFEGVDGRDYTYLGGSAVYVWDVTDPGNPVYKGEVSFDGRRVNDIKVTEDSKYAVATNEGASDRKNGIFVLDLADPASPKIVSEFTETLTGGVHNVFVTGRTVYAVHNGTRDVHIISIEDPANPKEVGKWGVENPARTLHDVWVTDGLLYVSYWDDGIWILDVGNGKWGGGPAEPKVVSHYSYPEGNAHAAFPYTNADGRSYLFVADERGDMGSHDTGLLHVLDMSDPENPVEVARYKAPGTSAHNLWVDDDKLYLAYYGNGLRIIDISGELRGQLHKQGREIAHFDTGSPNGYRPNSTATWGPQAYKGNIFASDITSGLWIVRLRPRDRTRILP